MEGNMSGVKEECGVFGIYDLDGGNIAPFIMVLPRCSTGDRSPAEWPFQGRTEREETYSFIKISDW